MHISLFQEYICLNMPFLAVEMGDFLQKLPFENFEKRVKIANKISLSLPSYYDETWLCSSLLLPWENEILLICYSYYGEDFLNLPRG